MTNFIIMFFVFFAVIFFGLMVIFWYSFRFEPVNFAISENEIILKRKTADEVDNKRKKSELDTSSLKILHLSDFHLRNDYKGSRLKSFLKILSLDDYDLIFITGDMAEKDELQDDLIDTLKGFKARYGIYAVLGAHDYYNKKPSEFIGNMFRKKESYSRKNDFLLLKKKLEDIGIKVLFNESLLLKNIEGFPEISIIGVDDPIIDKMDLEKSLENITPNPEIIKSDNFLKSLEYKQTFTLSGKGFHRVKEVGILKIALIHTPDSYAIANLSLNGADIIFAGHTHGGQVRIPGKGALISGCNIKTKFASGLFYFDDFVLQISRGLGEGRFSKFRIYCRPEAIITKLFYS